MRHSFDHGPNDVSIQSCKMNCENCDKCEIANWDCEEIAISQITQLNFLEGRNCENYENDEIEEFSSQKLINRN